MRRSVDWQGEASDLWGGNGTASTVTAFPVGECSNLWLGSSVIAWVKRSSTSVAMLILGFGGILGEWVAAIVFASSTSQWRWRDVDPHVGMLVYDNASTTV